MINEPDTIAFVGDWHMNLRWAKGAVEYAAKQGARVIIHLGDFGTFSHPSFLSILTRKLEEFDLVLYFVDGNHEDHQFLAQLSTQEDGTHRLTDRIFHLPRGYRWEWGGVTFLALGGAHSVDRMNRTPGFDWYPEETITSQQATQAIEGGPADIMVTHDCPSGVDIPDLGTQALQWPPEEIRSSEQHRELLRTVVDAVQPALLYHGHYHTLYYATLPLKTKKCTVVGLDCDRRIFRDNVLVVPLASIRATATMRVLNDH